MPACMAQEYIARNAVILHSLYDREPLEERVSKFLEQDEEEEGR